MRLASRWHALLALFALIGAVSLAADAGAGAAVEISSQEALALQESGEGLLFVDVRTPEEFGSGHVPGAVNIPIKQLPSRLAELGKDDRLVVYCERGTRSAVAVDTLIGAGYSSVSHLMGDMAGWRAACLPIEK